MKTLLICNLAIAALIGAFQTGSAFRADQPISCFDCEDWNKPIEPFRVFGNTYYVGTAGLSAVLFILDAGSILLDGALPQSAPLIDASIRQLGFKTEDVRLILNSHAHFDHVGGIAALQRASGAQVLASASGARALQQGYPTTDDPQFKSGRDKFRFPAVPAVRVVADEEVLRVGEIAITAHLTPGHTPGSTTWSWRSCEGATCLNVVYADSLNAVSDPGFRFTGDATEPSRIDSFLRSIRAVEHLRCDILLGVHPAPSTWDRVAEWKRQPDGPNPFVDATACQSYAAAARTRLQQRIADEGKGDQRP